jgi:hypothetical protein
VPARRRRAESIEERFIREEREPAQEWKAQDRASAEARDRVFDYYLSLSNRLAMSGIAEPLTVLMLPGDMNSATVVRPAEVPAAVRTGYVPIAVLEGPIGHVRHILQNAWRRAPLYGTRANPDDRTIRGNDAFTSPVPPGRYRLIEVVETISPPEGGEADVSTDFDVVADDLTLREVVERFTSFGFAAFDFIGRHDSSSIMARVADADIDYRTGEHVLLTWVVKGTPRSIDRLASALLAKIGQAGRVGARPGHVRL